MPKVNVKSNKVKPLSARNIRRMKSDFKSDSEI